MARKHYSERTANKPGSQLDYMRHLAVPLGRSMAPIHRDRSLTPDGMDHPTIVRSHIQPAKNVNPYSNREPRGEKMKPTCVARPSTYSNCSKMKPTCVARPSTSSNFSKMKPTCVARPSTSSNFSMPPRKLLNMAPQPTRKPHQNHGSYTTQAGKISHEKRNSGDSANIRPSKITPGMRNPSGDLVTRSHNPGQVKKSVSDGDERRPIFADNENIPEVSAKSPAHVPHRHVHHVQPQRRSPVPTKKVSPIRFRDAADVPGASRRTETTKYAERDAPPIKKKKAPTDSGAKVEDQVVKKNVDKAVGEKDHRAQEGAQEAGLSNKNAVINKDKAKEGPEAETLKKNVVKEKEVKKEREEESDDQERAARKNLKEAERKERKRRARILKADNFSIKIANKCLTSALVRINKVKLPYRPMARNRSKKVRAILDRLYFDIEMGYKPYPKSTWVPGKSRKYWLAKKRKTVQKKERAPPAVQKEECVPQETLKTPPPPKSTQKEQSVPPVVQKEKCVLPETLKTPPPPKSTEKEQSVPPVVQKEKCVLPETLKTPSPPKNTVKEKSVPPVVQKEKSVPPVVQKEKSVPPVVQKEKIVPDKKLVLPPLPVPPLPPPMIVPGNVQVPNKCEAPRPIPPLSSLPPFPPFPRLPPPTIGPVPFRLPPLKCPPLPPIPLPQKVPSPVVRPVQIVAPSKALPSDDTRKKTTDFGSERCNDIQRAGPSNTRSTTVQDVKTGSENDDVVILDDDDDDEIVILKVIPAAKEGH